MSARVLVVDDDRTTVSFLEAKLSAEYFDVATALSGPEALQAVEQSYPDVILLDIMMPGMDGYEVCRLLKASADTCHIPIIFVSAASGEDARLEALEAGGDDFITKPIDEQMLFARLRSLARAKLAIDDLRMRQKSGQHEAMAAHSLERSRDTSNASILVLHPDQERLEGIQAILSKRWSVKTTQSPTEAVALVGADSFDLIIMPSDIEGMDALRLCTQIWRMEKARQVPVLLLADKDTKARLCKALEIGVADFVRSLSDAKELMIRASHLLQRRYYQLALREDVQRSVTLALTDELTGMYNRRYLLQHLSNILRRSTEEQRDVSLLLLDIDHFKAINDTYGHQVGDEILQEFSNRLAKDVRGVDLVARYGGEEFVVVAPDTPVDGVYIAAERLLMTISKDAFKVSIGRVPITVSIGATSATIGIDSPETLMRRADQALYAAKRGGRNCIEVLGPGYNF